MREDGLLLSSENDALLGEVVTDDVLDMFLGLWKPEYGTPLDFGGGVKDVTCAQLIELCDGSALKLRKLFPFLTKQDAEAVLSSAKSQAASDV
jgi:hypothetical protein